MEFKTEGIQSVHDYINKPKSSIVAIEYGRGC